TSRLTGLRIPYLDGMRSTALAVRYIPHLSPFRRDTLLIILPQLIAFSMMLTASVVSFSHPVITRISFNCFETLLLALVITPGADRDAVFEAALPDGWVNLSGGDKNKIGMLYSRVSTLLQTEN